MMMNLLLRLTPVLLLFSTAPLSGQAFTEGKQVGTETKVLKPGEFVWEPERAPNGPLLMVVSQPEQVAYLYRNGIRIARSTVSTGKPGHETPVGVFTILGKEVMHKSNLYNDAAMPFMERLTWTGICMHAGKLPGYPASHGCIRLPLKFSELLYGATTKGMTVIIADDHSAPRETVHPGMAFAAPRPALPEPAKGTSPPPSPPTAKGTSWTPEKSPVGPVTILISGTNRVIVIYRNGMEIGRSPINLGFPPGQHVFSALEGIDEQGRRKWIRVDGEPAHKDPSFTDFATVGGVAPAFTAAVRSVVHPGTTMVVTDLPVDQSTQSGPDFKIMLPGTVPAQ